jgi:dTDP-4-amino-4,6-dideoxygalactose transaminase
MGAVPVFVDIDIHSHNINPNLINQAVTNKTKAIIGVSWQGLPCDIERIRASIPSDVILIDDSAQTLFDSPEKNNSMGLADISIYSFENKKHITTGSEGGMVVTDSEKLAEKIRKFSGIGYKHLTASAGRTSLAKSEAQRPNYLRFDTIGLNYRMSEVSAVIGLAQLQRLKEIIALRSDCAKIFLNILNKHPKIFDLQKDMNSKYHSYYTIGAVYNGSLAWEDFYNAYVQSGAQPFYAAVKNPYLEPAMLDYANKYKWKQQSATKKN